MQRGVEIVGILMYLRNLTAAEMSQSDVNIRKLEQTGEVTLGHLRSCLID